jgi:hypothetical protein
MASQPGNTQPGNLGDYQAIADYSKQENLKAMWAQAVIGADAGRASAANTATKKYDNK